MGERSGFVSVLEKASLAVDKAVGALCAVFFGAMTVIVLVGVFFRYVVNSPLSWVEESSRYLMIWGASSAISLGIRSGEHVGLTVLLDSLKSRLLKGALSIVIALVVFGFFAVLFAYSLGMVRDSSMMQTQALGFSMVVPYLAIPVSMVFAIVQLILTTALRLLEGAPAASEHSIDL